MKVTIRETEWWPVYTIETDDIDDETNVEIPQELYDDYVRVHNEFNLIDRKLSKLYNEQS